MERRVTVAQTMIRASRGVAAPGKLAAVLWDMDGTLVDSEPLWQAARDNMATKYGFAWTEEDHAAAIGRSLDESAERMRCRGLQMSVAQINQLIVSYVVAEIKKGPKWRPGALELLRDLRALGVQNALITMAHRPVAEEVARLAGGDVFDVVVTGDEVRRGKPDPEAYLTALEQLDLDAGVCVAIEDSASGVQSALAAGVSVLAVPYMSGLKEAETGGARVRDSLADVSVKDLEMWVSSI